MRKIQIPLPRHPDSPDFEILVQPQDEAAFMDSTTEVETVRSLSTRIVDRAEHRISRRTIPEDVLKVLYRLHRSGYQGYLCGGSVRDLLLDRAPKDYDVATDASPLEIRRLFRNSRIVGRRFRLVHVLFQDLVVEAATFRREPDARPESELLVTDDNTFGSPLQDARRRDFTINGMFYNIADFSVIDYVGGLEDLDQKLIRVIGDPDLRFREDPVRMMRAIEFASRLDFKIEQLTYDAILRHRSGIVKASAPRVSEEILELLRRGAAADAWKLLMETRLLEPILTEIYRSLRGSGVPWFWKMLEVMDRTVRAKRAVSDAVLLSVLFLPFVLQAIEREEAGRDTKLRNAEVVLFVRDLLTPISQRMALSAGMRHQVEQILETFWRLLDLPVDRKNVWRVVLRENFSEALALFELYAHSSGAHIETFRQWHALAGRMKRADAPEGAAAPFPRRRRSRSRQRPS
ncbi:MAG TPA: polynucleotide adenylyltransferase PcnB [Thermoanaerobaculia bacterium]|nr:polynucleotide adenylyltransferase PcnB [Thermoanaerobaculia bacterium]